MKISPSAYGLLASFAIAGLSWTGIDYAYRLISGSDDAALAIVSVVAVLAIGLVVILVVGGAHFLRRGPRVPFDDSFEAELADIGTANTRWSA